MKTQQEILEKIKKELLSDFKLINEEFIANNIFWWAHSGTLLGVVRNNNMIEWDDDIDMMMTYADFFNNFNLIEKIVKKYNYDLYCLNKTWKDSLTVRIVKRNSRFYKQINHHFKRNMPFIDLMIAIPYRNLFLFKFGYLYHRIHYYSIYNRIYSSFITRLLLLNFFSIKMINYECNYSLKNQNSFYHRFDWWPTKKILYSKDNMLKIKFESTIININCDYLDELSKWYGKDFLIEKKGINKKNHYFSNQ